MFALFLEAIIVGLSAFYIASFLNKRNNYPDFLINWFILFFAQIVAVNLGLGIFSRLFLVNIILVDLLFLLAVFLLARGNNYFKFNKADLAFIFENKVLILACSFFIAFFLIKIGLQLFKPSAYADVIQYHLPFPAYWVKHGNLFNPIVVFDKNNPNILNALSYFPINAELFFFWLMLPLRNSLLANLGQAPFYIVGILAIYSILRKFLLDKPTALLTGVIWAIIPNIFKQMQYGALVDVICAVMFLVVVNNLLNVFSNPSFPNAVLFGIATGLFLGIKAINIFWFLALAPLFVYILYSIQKGKGLFRNSGIISTIVLCVLAFGSFSYIRNFILTGNIFYPIEFKLFGKVIMPGAIDKITYSRFIVPWEEFSFRNMFFGEGLGLQFTALIFPGTIVPWLFFKYFKKGEKGRLLHFLLFLVPPAMFILFVFYIKAYWIRYFFPYLGLGLLCSAIFLNAYKWGRRYLLIVSFICIFSSAAELARHTELIIALLAACLLFLFFLLFGKRMVSNRKIFYTPIFLSSAVIILFLFLYCTNLWYDKNEFNRYPFLYSRKEQAEKDTGFSWIWVNEHTGKGMRIAYAGRAESYPLYGTRLKNDVFYISVNDKPSIPHYYPDGDYRKEQNFDIWLKNLRRENIDMLVVYQMHGSKDFPVEDAWARSRPDIFKPAFSNSRSRIYYLLK